MSAGSRLARQMRPHLGAGLWDEFVSHANRHYKAGWLRAFAPASGALRCMGARGAGRSEGGGWDGSEAGVRGWHDPRAAAPGPRPRAAAACDVPPVGRGNGRGNGTTDWTALCHDLFGVRVSEAHGAAYVRFRCGPPRDAKGVVLQFVNHA